MRLILCPATSLSAVYNKHEPSHVLIFLSPDAPAPILPRGPERLVLRFNDIAGPRAGLVAPAEVDVAALLRFGREWNGTRPLVVSCGMGISRSTAAAFAIACDRQPEMTEADIAASLRDAAPCATPNPLVVALADTLLGRAGRLVAAAAAIGRGADYRPYEWLTWDFACPLPA